MSQAQQAGILLLSGPLTVLLLASLLATVAVTLGMMGRLEGLLALGERTADRLHRGRAVPVLWGLAGTILLLLSAAFLFQVPALGLLGLALLGLTLVLAGLGAGAAGLVLGRALAALLGRAESDDLSTTALGLRALLLASVFPFLGWLAALLTVLAGTGAVIEALVTRTSR